MSGQLLAASSLGKFESGCQQFEGHKRPQELDGTALSDIKQNVMRELHGCLDPSTLCPCQPAHPSSLLNKLCQTAIAWRSLFRVSPESGSDQSTNARYRTIMAFTARPVIVGLRRLSPEPSGVPCTGHQCVLATRSCTFFLKQNWNIVMRPQGLKHSHTSSHRNLLRWLDAYPKPFYDP